MHREKLSSRELREIPVAWQLMTGEIRRHSHSNETPSTALHSVRMWRGTARFNRIYPNATTGRTGASYFHSASLPVSELCVVSSAVFTTHIGVIVGKPHAFAFWICLGRLKCVSPQIPKTLFGLISALNVWWDLA